VRWALAQIGNLPFDSAGEYYNNDEVLQFNPINDKRFPYLRQSRALVNGIIGISPTEAAHLT